MRMMRSFKFYLCLAALFVVHSLQAKRVDVKWGTIAGAEKFEYQIGNNEAFSGNVIRSGTTKNLYFVTDLGPGVYYLRVRGLDDAGRGGAWSQASRIVVEADALEIRKPVAGELIEVAGKQASFFVEWSAVEGASDYQVLLRQGATQKNVISPTNSVRIEGIESGEWVVSIAARVGGQVIQKSKDLSFRLVTSLKPRPVIYSPISGESAVAWDNFTIRWLNSSKTPRSEVVVRRLGNKGGVISREVVVGAAQTLSPKLPPGNYQVTVRNLFEHSHSEAASVDVAVVEDAMGYHAQYFGVSMEAVLGPTVGFTGFRNSLYDSEVHRIANASGEIDFRLLADFTSEWGAEFSFGARGDRFTDILTVSGSNTAVAQVDSSRLQLMAVMGARYKLDVLGPAKPLWLRGWIFWRGVEMPVGSEGITGGLVTSEPAFRISNARIWGTGLGAELRWGGFRSRWDAVGRVDLLLPWIANGKKFATGGVSPFLPTLELRVIPRVKISAETRLGLILGGRYESLTFKEKGRESSKLYSYRFFLMPNLSWDL